MTIIYGVQPVLEALRAGQPIQSIQLSRIDSGIARKIREEAKARSVPVIEVPKNALDRKAGTTSHQGVVATMELSEGQYVEIEELVESARSKNEAPLILLLDEIQDPNNLGAMIRSAYAFGAHGVIIPKRRAASLTPAVMKVSAGAAAHLPIARVGNLKHAISFLKNEDIWCAAATLDGEPAETQRLDGPLALVVGSEGSGVRPSLAEQCDFKIRIVLERGFDSLNASVAAGVLLYEVSRQRRAAGPASLA